MIETNNAQMILDALRARRSISRVLPDDLPRETIETIIESAGWAPNHYKTEPWRFVVISGEARDRFGDAMAESLRRRLPAPDSEDCRAMIEKERGKPLRAPVIIVVAVEPSDLPKVKEIEEI